MLSHARRLGLGLAAVAALLAPLAPRTHADSTPGASTYTVLLADHGSRQAALEAIAAAGGTVSREVPAIGGLVVTSSNSGFTRALSGNSAVLGAVSNRPIGRTRVDMTMERAGRDVMRPIVPLPSTAFMGKPDQGSSMDPFDAQQWGLAMVNAEQARGVDAGRPEVLVGILSTGIDASHPDLAANFDWVRSRNFTTDIPTDENGAVVDGPCEVASCRDPIGRDDNGNGTFLAGIVGAAANGIGVSGVAPSVRLVDIHVGQDSGFFFLQPFVDGLTHAADHGVDVVVLGFFVDPWLFNCADNPADSPASQAEQRLIVRAVTSALNYAHEKGVTLVGAIGNQHMDLGAPQPDDLSPNFPSGAAYTRNVANASCLQLPIEGPHVIGVSSLGPSLRKADYSSYGTERVSVAGPGGFFRDFFGTPGFRTNDNLILSTYPQWVLAEQGLVDADGNVAPSGIGLVEKACDGSRCGFYFRQQGTSMAAAHATGVAALIVSRYGKKDKQGGFGLAPDSVASVLLGTAAPQPCPDPPTVTYANEGRDATYDATCVGDANFNGFYGHGIVDAFQAVKHGAKFVKGNGPS